MIRRWLFRALSILLAPFAALLFVLLVWLDRDEPEWCPRNGERFG